MSLPEAIWRLLEKQLCFVGSSAKAGLFNPYNSVEPSLDRSGADRIRRENLRRYTECFGRAPKYLLVGEAPGWRGCRFSGVPFTSEAQLSHGRLPFTGEQSSHRDEPHEENSANFMWEELKPLHPEVFLWNAVPLHPHPPGRLEENRKPTTEERKRFEPLMEALIGILKPQEVVAVGRVAERALAKYQPRYVRHPSFGGAPEFRKGMKALARSRRI
jgi:uracil-DNA glycosylase